MAKKPTKTKKQAQSDEDLIEVALKEAKLSTDATEQQRIKEVEDLEFESGEHFTPAEKKQRQLDSRPAEVFDQLSGPILQVTNQPIPRIVVSPIGNDADPKTAEYWQGYLRNVENRARVEAPNGPYKWARWHTARMGRGWWRIRHDYLNWRSRQMDLRIESIDNQHTVYPDPRAWLSPTNGKFGILAEYLLWDDFIEQYGEKAEKQDVTAFRGSGDMAPGWCDKEKVRVAERYWIVMSPTILCEYDDGRVLEKDEKGATEGLQMGQVVNEWEAMRPRVKWMKFTAAEILEQADVPGEFIPIVQIDGQRRNINGKLDYRGLVRMARGPQRMLNFNENALIEMVNHGSFVTWLAEEDQVSDLPEWQAPHITKPAVLRYKRVDVGGHPVDKPEHVSHEPAIRGVAIAAERAQNHVRHVTGVPDVFMEEHKSEQSGRAINQRRQQQELTTGNYNDGLADGVALTGRILMSMGREVLDVPRVLRFTGLDEKDTIVIAHGGPARKQEAEQLYQRTLAKLTDKEKAGLKGFFDTRAGDFDVTIQPGRSSDTGRQETRETLTELIPIMPPPMQIKAIPLLVKHLDSPGMQELAAALAPDDEQQIPQQVQERLKQLDQFAQIATEQIHTLKDQLADKQADRESKEKIALAQIESQQVISATSEETKRLVAMATIDKELALANIQAEQAQLSERAGMRHEASMGAANAGLALTQQQQQGETEREMAELGHEQAIEQGEMGHAQNLEAQQQAAELAPQPEVGV